MGAGRDKRGRKSAKQLGVADVWERSMAWPVSVFFSYVCFNGDQPLGFVHSLDS